MQTFITSLLDTQFKIVKPIPVIIMKFSPGNYIANVPIANIGASGDTVQEAINNLKDTIAAKYRLFASKPPKVLGTGPTKQLHFLKEHITF